VLHYCFRRPALLGERCSDRRRLCYGHTFSAHLSIPQERKAWLRYLPTLRLAYYLVAYPIPGNAARQHPCIRAAFSEWAMLGSNQRSMPCEGSSAFLDQRRIEITLPTPYWSPPLPARSRPLACRRSARRRTSAQTGFWPGKDLPSNCAETFASAPRNRRYRRLLDKGQPGHRRYGWLDPVS
jgi:hypothetical protein